MVIQVIKTFFVQYFCVFLPPHLNLFCFCLVSSVAQLCLTLCDPMDCSTPGFPVHHQLPELVQAHVHRVGDAIQPSHPVLSPPLLLPSVFPSIRVFSNESAVSTRWPKHWSFSFSISPGVVIRIKRLNTYKAVSMFPDTGNRISISFTEILPSSVGLGFKLD